jgi:flagellar hook assembly protein FlgD
MALHLEAVRPGRYQGAILDVQGRLVRALHEGGLEQGTHRFDWDGRDDAGRTVVAGVYFYAVRGEGEVAASKIVRVL